MKKGNKGIRVLSVIMISIFVNFMFANTIFTHLHTLPNGSRIYHSHPYIPTGQHSHNANFLSLISSFNNAVTSFQGVAPFMLAIFATMLPSMHQCVTVHIESRVKFLFFLKSPPVLV